MMSVLIAVLLCPFIVSSSSCESDADGESPTTKLVFDETEINIYNSKNEKMHSGDIITLGKAIRIEPVHNNVRVTMNGMKFDTIGELFGSPIQFFQTNELLIETFNFCSISFEYINNKIGLATPDTIHDVSITDQVTLPTINHDGVLLKEWYVTINGEKESFLPGDMTIDRDFMSLMKDDTTSITLSGLLEYNNYDIILKSNGGIVEDESWIINSNGDYIQNYTIVSDDIILPLVRYDWYEFIGWIDENGNLYDTIRVDTCSNMTLFANHKLKEFKVNFYEDKDASESFESIMMTIENYQTPLVLLDSNFIGWFYKDQNDTECEFKEGVPLQDNMAVYAKYDETAKVQDDNTESTGSNDADIYSILTKNGVRITDNEAVETVVASVTFVMLALVTFLIVFKRH